MKNKEFKKHLGKSFQKARKKGGYKSAGAFARVLGINEYTYIGYEQGQGLPPIDTIWQIAQKLNISLDELCGFPAKQIQYSDKKQEELNGHYETLNDQAKTDLVGFVRSFAADPARRIVKEGQEALSHKSNMDRIA